MSAPRLRKLHDADRERHVDHLLRVLAESGQGGDPPFNPRELRSVRRELLAQRHPTAWRVPVGEPGWIRTWGMCDGQRVIGHVELWGGPAWTEMHRATLGLALERGWRRRGLGRAMCEHAIAWCREQGLAWLDLGVFAPNAGAAALYRELGFVELGRRPDAFRIYGDEIEDIQMTLRLAPR